MKIMKKMYLIAFMYFVLVMHVVTGSAGEQSADRMKALNPSGAGEIFVFHDVTFVKVNPMLLLYSGKVWRWGIAGAHATNKL